MIATLASVVAQGRAQRSIETRFAGADVRIGGDRPWDIRVHDERVYRSVLLAGSLGLGDAYVAGWWDCAALDECFTRLLRAGLDEARWSPADWWIELRARLANRQRPSRAREVAHRHYDRDGELHRAMLGDERVYSCGYWARATTLAEAQTAKIDLVCRKLGLRPGQRVLDIGCGWGEAARHAAQRYGVEVVGVTVSAAQAEAARERCRGLPVTIIEDDYRALGGRFDRILSIGMFEHVGPRNYRTYLRVARRLLTDDGLFLLHTIGGNRTAATIDLWIDRHVFPNAVLPSAAAIASAAEGLFVIEDWHGFGPDYDRTLMAWHERLMAAWDGLGAAYDERARRRWRYYLLTCAASFRARKNQLWQIVLSPRGVVGGYAAVR
ncbi:MAG TPA: cyclopropane fatty acyl phospholipid synthase [Planctomycetota bacterium]|nr:cyclopropane fatty acyl phospholipid synthase [Planctomycetota bacterium]